MKFRTALVLAVLALGLAGGCARRVIRIPATQIHVVNEIDSAPIEGVNVSVTSRLPAGGKEQLFSGTTDSAGSVAMPETVVRGMRGLEVRFQWETAGTQAELMFMAPPTRFPGNDNPPAFRVASERSGYLGSETEKPQGDCINLFQVQSGLETIHITFTRPSSFLGCDEIALTNGDVQEIGRRDINAGDFDSLPAADARELSGQIRTRFQSVSGIAPADLPEVAAYVDGLVQRLVRASDVPGAKLSVELYDAGIGDALCLPSGTMLVDVGVVRAAQNESEAAGALAVQVARFAARQGTEAMTSAAAAALAAVHRGQVKLEKQGISALDAYIDNAMIDRPGFWPLAWGAGWAAEADVLAAQYLWNAGIDPLGLARALDRMSAAAAAGPGLLDPSQTAKELSARALRVREFAARFLPPRSDLSSDSQTFQDVSLGVPRTIAAGSGAVVPAVRQALIQVSQELLREFVKRQAVPGE